jgi:hypothetical protein
MGDLDGMDMTTEPATEGMGRVATAGQHMSTDWAAADTRISGLAGQLGAGPMGAAFLSGYGEPATQVSQTVAQCCRMPGDLAARGHTCVETYVDTDATNGDMIRSLGPQP